MSSQADRTLVQALGRPGEVVSVSFISTIASGLVDGDSVYRFAATEDCYFYLSSGIAGGAADSTDTLLFGGLPEIFQCSTLDTCVVVTRKDTDGTLNITKMTSPRK